MKTKSILMLMLLAFAFSVVQAQDLPPKHRGLHPNLLADGKVVDEHGRQLGYITEEGKVCDVTGKIIGIIAATGEVTTANGKGIIGVIRKDGSLRTKKGYVVSTGGDGVVLAAGKMVGHVDLDYKNKSHGCALHCFFSFENQDAVDIDENTHQ